GHEDIFFTLVAAGANLHATGGYGESVLANSVAGITPGRLRMVQAVLAAGGIHPDDNLPNAFAHACRHASQGTVAALLAAGADPNHAYMPLWTAVKLNRPEIVAQLIRAGADIKVRVPREDYGENKHVRKTLVEAARAEGFTEVAALLEAAGGKAS